MGTGLQEIPFRIPERWDAHWYALHLRDVLALADARNSIGVGLTVTGEPNTLATYSVNEDIRNLVNQPFVLTSPSGFLPNERVLEGESGVISVTDFGPGTIIEIGIEDHGIEFDKLVGLNDFGVLGQPAHDPGGPEQIIASEDGDVLCVQSDVLGFTNTPVWSGDHTWVDGAAARFGTGADLSIEHTGAAATITNVTGALTVSSSTGNLALSAAAGDILFTAPALTDFLFNGETLAEIAQDATGTIFVDSASIDFTYNDGVPSITASVIESWSPTWTANHRWSDNDEVQLGTGGDLRLYHDGTDSYISNSTGLLRIEVAGGPGTTARINASTGGRALDINSAAANGPYITFLRSGTAFADFGNAAQLISGGTLDGVGFVTRGTQPIELGTSSQRRWVGTDAGHWRLVGDNYELQLGVSQDLRLYHNGTDSVIENDTGNLVLRVNGDLSLDEVGTATTATGGARTLPANPVDFLVVVINGTSRKIPYYAT